MSNKQPTGLPFLHLRLLAIAGLILLNLGTALAEAPPATPPAAPAPASGSSSGSTQGDTYSQFKVGDYLTIKEEKTQTTSGNTVTFGTTSNVGLKGEQQKAYLESQNPVGAFILQIINLIALTAASLSFLAVVVAGFLMMSAAGNENQLNKGKEILTKAIVGLVITLSAYFIVSFVQNLLFETVSK